MELYIPSSFKKYVFHICTYASFYIKKKSKLPNPEGIDRVICVELLDNELEPKLYRTVCDNMIHGPCGTEFPFMPCMKKGKCSKGFPKDYTYHPYIDDNGYPIYKRRNNENNVVKNGVSLFKFYSYVYLILYM
uniref:Uncharacterized protein n=1 Tax=Lactuca sativa TaxID=4236 RepID=A0A9R1UQT7_LACSA|nr:hypothetical protein LSAT_V11C800409470 [Lactuca sativa]